MNIDELLKEVRQIGASDLHLAAGLPAVIRLNGALRRFNNTTLTPSDTKQFLEHIAPKYILDKFNQDGDADFSYACQDVGRFRINAFLQRSSVGLAIRAIKNTIPSLEELCLPDILKSLALKQNGLILVTGPTGSGKSTTLAALVDYINSTRECNILTLEDPIEYLYASKRSFVRQREIYSDSLSFQVALRSALRQDPDVILVGEMRDVDSMAITVTAAETGQLVLASLHTADTRQAITRIIEAFPPMQQQQIRVQLAQSLIGIVAQQLIPKMNENNRIVATEILLANTPVKNAIRNNELHHIPTILQTNQRAGMHSMDMSLKNLYQRKQISREEAMLRCFDKQMLTEFLRG